VESLRRFSRKSEGKVSNGTDINKDQWLRERRESSTTMQLEEGAREGPWWAWKLGSCLREKPFRKKKPIDLQRKESDETSAENEEERVRRQLSEGGKEGCGPKIQKKGGARKTEKSP